MKSIQIRSYFWSVFSHIRTEYGEIRRISPYSVRMRENTDQKQLLIWTLFTQLIYKVKLSGISGSLLKLIQNYLDNRFQRVLLNGQTSEWKPVKAGVPQGSILGPLFFLVYINDICSNLSTNVKLFADDTSLFSIVNDANKSFENLSNDLCIISNWAYQWKMSFNPDRSKQAQEVIF